MAKTPPTVYVIAGPNGAGKTTFACTFLPRFAKCPHFINADLIAAGLSPLSPEASALEAGKLLLAQIDKFVQKRTDFGFETTLAGRSYRLLFRRLKERGYKIHAFFLWVPTVELALARIRERVQRGGHAVPEPDVRRRFQRGLTNFFRLYQPLFDAWVALDNSGAEPTVVAFQSAGQLTAVSAAQFALLQQQAGVT